MQTRGGNIAPADTGGSVRYSGRSPTTTCTTTSCGAMVTPPRSGTTGTMTSTPACSHLMGTTISSDTCRHMPAAAPATLDEPPRRPRGPIAQLAQMCGQDTRDIAGLPIDQIQQTIQPNAEQLAALDDLANASLKAAQDIRAACPTEIALTAPDRLTAMQQRIEAMISAVATVQPALDKFYGLLSDEQKARLTALGNDQRRTVETTGSLVQTCAKAQSGVMEWPTAEIDRRVRPTETQRASLEALQNASAKAADLLKASCAADNALTPPARLAAVGKRLDTMLEAVKTVHSALNDFYASLNDEQKAQFEAIGPSRTSQR